MKLRRLVWRCLGAAVVGLPFTITAFPPEQQAWAADPLSALSGLAGGDLSTLKSRIGSNQPMTTTSPIDTQDPRNAQLQSQYGQMQPTASQQPSTVEQDYSRRLRQLNGRDDDRNGHHGADPNGLYGAYGAYGAYGNNAAGRLPTAAPTAQGSSGTSSWPTAQRSGLSGQGLPGMGLADDPSLSLSLFGYDSFMPRNGVVLGSVSGRVPDTYRMDVGDELVIAFRGQRSDWVRVRVDSQGMIALSQMEPIPAMGRPFGDVRADLEQVVDRTFPGTQLSVSLSDVRAITVTMMGEVDRPGSYSINGMDGLMDALSRAGGVRKTGSLRRITIQSAGKKRTVDLYQMLVSGNLARDALSLAEGDQVLVHPLGPTVAIAGDVKRPGIFELPSSGFVSVDDALALAGGTLRGSGYQLLRVAPSAGGADTVSNLGTSRKGMTLRDGNMLLVNRAVDAQNGVVTLDGNVTVPGVRSLDGMASATDLLRDRGIFKDHSYLSMVVIQRLDPATHARYTLGLNLTSIAGGAENVRFQDGDRVIVLSDDDVRFLSSDRVQDLLRWQQKRQLFRADMTVTADDLAQMQQVANGGTQAGGAAGVSSLSTLAGGLNAGQSRPNGTASTSGTPTTATLMPPPVDDRCTALKSLRQVVSQSRAGRFAKATIAGNEDPNAQSRSALGQDPSLTQPDTCPMVFSSYPDLLPYLLDYSVLLQGEVHMPGVYPVTSNSPLSSLVVSADGLSQEADTARIEVSRYLPEDQRQRGQGSLRQVIDAGHVSLQQVLLQPGDVVRFNPAFTNRDEAPVVLAGEFRSPGLYTISRGEKLSEVMARAGGVNDEAYPLGAVITRQSIKAEEVQNLDRIARNLESAVAVALAQGDNKDKTASTASAAPVLTSLVQSIRTQKTIGRLVAEADPAVLTVQPEKDLLLQPGDKIYMPKRPHHIMLAGEVLNPGAQQFVSGLTPTDYVRQAGGLSNAADDSQIYVVFPNGLARAVSLSAWNFENVRIPPGSTIFVPRDVRPFSIGGAFRDWLDVAYKIALSAAAVGSLND